MEYRVVKGNLGKTSIIAYEIPKICPNCKVANNPRSTFLGVHTNIYSIAHLCLVCQKYHSTIQAMKNKFLTILVLYPEYVSSQLPEILVERSPRFASLYFGAELAESKGFLDLAGMGYRAALEVLVKDYALIFELDSEEDIAKQNLNNSIAKYFKDDADAFSSAEVVRILGNDFTHWRKDYDFPLSTTKTYIDVFIKLLEFKFLTKFPPVSKS